MKQTAVQLLKEALDYEMKSGTKMVVNWDMYLEIEKEQMMDAHLKADVFPRKYEFEQYYKETYGNNELGHSLNWSGEVAKGHTNTISYEQAIEIVKDMNKQPMTFVPNEISDEEIDNNIVKEYENVGDEKLFPNFTDKDIWGNGFYEGAKWYREQLKQRQ